MVRFSRFSIIAICSVSTALAFSWLTPSVRNEISSRAENRASLLTARNSLHGSLEPVAKDVSAEIILAATSGYDTGVVVGAALSAISLIAFYTVAKSRNSITPEDLQLLQTFLRNQKTRSGEEDIDAKNRQ